MTTARDPAATGWTADDSTFGARLALIRQRMRWGNVKEAAQQCGLPTESWRSWERDGREPRGLLNISLKISGVTGCDYRWLALGPERQSAATTERSEATTLQYQALGERVVTKGMTDRAITPAHGRPGIRTRPIDGRRTADLLAA